MHWRCTDQTDHAQERARRGCRQDPPPCEAARPEMAGLRVTSAYSAYLRGHDELRSRRQQLDRIVVTPIVLGELDAGFRAGSQRKKNQAEAAAIPGLAAGGG